jgi:NADPH:quinone reductase-like Zn-dependent oxidoreductase
LPFIDTHAALGADHVIDYTQEDFTRNGQRYDLILAVNGYHSISNYLRTLTPGGICVVAGGPMFQLFQAVLKERQTSQTGKQKTRVASLVQNQEDLVVMIELIESRKIAPVIDRCYPLSKASEALWYFEKVHPKGKVIITVEQNGE